MNTLYISYDGMTDPLGQSQVIPYLIGLSNKGINITLLSTEKKENYIKHKDKIAKILQDNKISWQTISYTKKPPIISTIIDIYKLHKKAKKIYKTKNFKLVHCRSYIAAFVGLYYKKKKKTAFLFDMRGFYADERLDGKLWDINKPIFKAVYNFFKKKEKQFLQSADFVVSLTNSGKKIINSWTGFESVPIEVIPCAADLNFFSDKNINRYLQTKLKEKLNIKNSDFVLSYLGSVGSWYLLDEMMQFFKILQNKKPNAKFLFISKENKFLITESAVKNKVNTESIIIKPTEREDLPTILSLSTASIFFIKSVFSKQASSPTKMGELMSMGVPIIANAGVGDINEIMNNDNYGIIITELNKENYKIHANEIDKLQKIDKNKLKEGASKYYSLKKGVEKYFEIYKTITNLND